MKKFFLALALSCVSSASVYANACTIEAGQKTTNIYFSNGVWNDAADMLALTEFLEGAYKSSLEIRFPGEVFDFRSAPNPTEGYLTDIIQVLAQKADELGIEDDGLSAYQIFDWVRAGLNEDEVRSLIAVSVGIIAKQRLAGTVTNAALTELSNTLNDATAQALSSRVSVNNDHINEYESQLLSGRRIVIVAHSQGNLFANETVNVVQTRNPNQADSIAIIGVATPASRVIANNRYITANDDFIIDLLRALGREPVLPGNIDNDLGSLSDPRPLFGLNHTFQGSYLQRELPTRTWIDNEVTRLMTTLPFPPVIAGEGAIRATLTWGAEPDMDLHVFEPRGSHVFYSNRVGTSGTLDVDDVSSFGPENYFVPCDNAELGTYAIGVNYFRGTSPETARISLFLGNGQTVSPRSITLAQGIGSSGNQTPSILFRVTINEPEPGRFTYDVE